MGAIFSHISFARGGERKNQQQQAATSLLTNRLIAPIIRKIDAFLRRRLGIFEFTADERCAFRLSLRKFNLAHRWPDGTTVDGGVVVGELHLWHEHLTGLPMARNLGYASEFRSRLLYSLCALADWAASNPAAARLPGFFADYWIRAEEHPAGLARALARWGFQVDQDNVPFAFWDQLYARLLTCAFKLENLPRRLRRVRIWISRDELLRRYAVSASTEPEHRNRTKRDVSELRTGALRRNSRRMIIAAMCNGLW